MPKTPVYKATKDIDKNRLKNTEKFSIVKEEKGWTIVERDRSNDAIDDTELDEELNELEREDNKRELSDEEVEKQLNELEVDINKKKNQGLSYNEKKQATDVLNKLKTQNKAIFEKLKDKLDEKDIKDLSAEEKSAMKGNIVAMIIYKTLHIGLENAVIKNNDPDSTKKMINQVRNLKDDKKLTEMCLEVMGELGSNQNKNFNKMCDKFFENPKKFIELGPDNMASQLKSKLNDIIRTKANSEMASNNRKREMNTDKNMNLNIKEKDGWVVVD